MPVTVSTTRPVLIQAEAYNSAGSNWQVVSDITASGLKSMGVRPGLSQPGGTIPTSAEGRLSYAVDFAEAGTYHIQLRGKATGNLVDSDTVRVGFDGRDVTGADGLTGNSLGYHWNSEGGMVVTVTQPGTHTIDVWAREAGFNVDAIYVTGKLTERPGEFQATRAGEFWDSVGVNTHLGWIGSAYSDATRVETALSYLGIRHIRDQINESWDGDYVDLLGSKGYKFSLLVSNLDNHDLAWKLREIAERGSAVAIIEGPNEVDFNIVNHAGQTGYAAVGPYMRDIWNWAQANMKGIPIAQASIAHYENFAKLGDLSAYADYANAHVYFPNGEPPGLNINQRIAEAQLASPGRTPIMTETGHFTGITTDTWGRVSELAQAKYMPRVLLEGFTHGVERSYIYELFEPWAGHQSSWWGETLGLFRPDGTPKQAATAVRNLISVVKDDPDATFTPGTLDYKLQGMPGTAEDLLLQRSDGTFVLALWNDVRVFDSTNYVDISVAPVPITITLGDTAKSVVMHNTLTGARTVLPGGQTIQVNVPDHAVLLEIVKDTAPPPVDPPPSTGGPGTLTLAGRETDFDFDPAYAKSVVLSGADQTISAGTLGVPGVTGNPRVAVDVEGGVTTIRLDPTSGSLPLARIADADGGSYRIEGFVHAEALTGAGVDRIVVAGARRGEVRTGEAADTVTVTATGTAGGGRWDKADTVVVHAGGGNDTVSVDGAADASWVNIVGGAGDDRLFVTEVAGGRVGGGAGADVIELGARHGTMRVALGADLAEGDVITGFAGAGVAGGDVLAFWGYGTGSVTALGGGEFRVTSADGRIVDEFTLTGVSTLAAGDYVFT